MVIKIETILDSAADQLVRRPDSTLTALAAAAGVSRTTLFYRFGSREGLIEALALDTLALMRSTLNAVEWRPEDPESTILDVATALMPLSTRMQVTLRDAPLQSTTSVETAWSTALMPIANFVAAAQACGTIRLDADSTWRVHSLVYLMFAGWDLASTGDLGSKQAARLVAQTWLLGCHGQGDSRETVART